jgi:para-nitrobenzyl esterase
MRFLLLLILGSVGIIPGSAGIKALADAPVVHTQNGDVLGVLQGSVESFKALPYAAPPVGDLRWKAPQDPANWLGVRDGSKFSSACTQKKDVSVIGSEDCLYLNVFRPRGAHGLPVIVFVHGGHNAIDSAGVMQNGVAGYDGAEFAQNGNVVVVTINYRLGPLGFIAHPELSKESGYAGSGNYGYMDQIRALKWVRSNIAAFGGEPNNVTLFGHSSGGGGVMVLMASPLGRGLFHRAIIHSGQLTIQDLKTAEAEGVSLSQKLKCRNEPDELACMRGKSATEIVVEMPGGHDNVEQPSVRGPSHFLPIVDGRVLPDSPLAIIGRGEHLHVPILIGNAKEETSWIYGDESKDIQTAQDYMNAVNKNYGALAPKLLGLYPSSDYQSPRQAYDAISADHWFVCPAQRLTQAVSVSQSEFVGRFLYTHVPSGPVIPPTSTTLGSPAYYGASHGFDLLFVFGTFGYFQLTPTLDELNLKEKVQKAWANFARSGSPGDFWKRYDATQDNYAIINMPIKSGAQLDTNQCDFWYPVGKPATEVPKVTAESAATPSVVNEGGLPSRELSFGRKQ